MQCNFFGKPRTIADLKSGAVFLMRRDKNTRLCLFGRLKSDHAQQCVVILNDQSGMPKHYIDTAARNTRVIEIPDAMLEPCTDLSAIKITADDSSPGLLLIEAENALLTAFNGEGRSYVYIDVNSGDVLFAAPQDADVQISRWRVVIRRGSGDITLFSWPVSEVAKIA